MGSLNPSLPLCWNWLKPKRIGLTIIGIFCGQCFFPMREHGVIVSVK